MPPSAHASSSLAALLLACSWSCSPASDAPAAYGGGSPSGGSPDGGSSPGASGVAIGGSAVASGAGGQAGSTAGSGGTPTAGVTSGGSSDAGSSGASGGSTSDSFCEARAGLAFCEDFEAMAVGTVAASGPWKAAINGEGTITIVQDQHHSGKQALRVLGGGFSTFLVYHDAQVLPAASGRFYVRTFMRLAAAMTPGHNTFIIGDLTASPGTGNALRLGEMNEMLMYTVSGDTHGALANDNYYTDHLPGAALPAGGWGCLEIMIDSTAPELRVWLDGAEIEDLRHTDFSVDPYDALRFGFEKYAGPESEIFYDDIAIGSEPIGCR